MASFDLDALEAALQRMSALGGESELEPTLQRLVKDIGALFQSAGAGLMFVDDSGSLRYVAASDDQARLLEVAQEEVGRGPCVDALLEDRITTTSDVSEDERWPDLAQRMRPTGVRAVMGVPVHVAATPIGSLDVYHTEPHRWDDAEADALERLKGAVESLIASSLLAHRRDEIVTQLQGALDTRVVIERAIGLIMGREAVGSAEAFNRLRRLARSERRRVYDVAQELLDGRRLPRA